MNKKLLIHKRLSFLCPCIIKHLIIKPEDNKVIFRFSPIVGFCNVLCVALCPFLFCNHLDREERAGCFALFVFLVSLDSCAALPHDTKGLSAVCDCGFFLTILTYYF